MVTAGASGPALLRRTERSVVIREARVAAPRPATQETTCDPARDPRPGALTAHTRDRGVAGRSPGPSPTSPPSTSPVSLLAGKGDFDHPRRKGQYPAQGQRDLCLASMSSSPRLPLQDPEPGTATGNPKTHRTQGPSLWGVMRPDILCCTRTLSRPPLLLSPRPRGPHVE